MKTALLLIDIQNDYFEGGKNELVEPRLAAQEANRLLSAFREKCLPVVHVQHVATRADATFFIPNTEGVKIHEFVSPRINEEVIEKHFPNSFRETRLLEVLKKENVTHLVVCGMMTHMCIDTTVRAAKDLGFECIVPFDACATKNLVFNDKTVDAKHVQYSFMAALSYFFAKVVTTEAVLSELV